MRRWTVNGPTIFDDAQNYAGENLSHLLVVPVSRSRDSNPLDESNFEEALRLLGGESDAVQIHRFGHWACGWYELLLIDPADTKAVRIGEDIEARLDNYPCLNEEDYADREWRGAQDSWDSMCLQDRIEICDKAGLSIFAARHDDMPGEVFEELRPE